MRYLGNFDNRLALSTVPVFVCRSDDRLTNIEDFGSGFFLRYRDILYFVSADHVVHQQDFDEGFRQNQDFTPWVYTNYIEEEKGVLFLPMISANYFSSANLENICTSFPDRLGDAIEQLAAPSEDAWNDPQLADVAVPNLHDIIFSRTNQEVLNIIFSAFYPSINGRNMNQAGQNISIIDESEIGMVGEYHTYKTGGFIDNYIDPRTMQWNSLFRFLYNLTFHSREERDDTHPDEIVWLNCPDIFIENELKGMSGAPVFDNDNHLCGIVVRTVHLNHTIGIYPIQNLLRFLDYNIRIASLPPAPPPYSPS